MSGGADGVQEERERVRALLDLDTSTEAEEKVVRAAIREGDTPGEAARRILERRKQRRQARLDAFRQDEEELEAPGPSTAEDTDVATEVRKLVAAGRRAGVSFREEAR